MKIIKPFAYSYPAIPDVKVTILGAGNVAKSLLLTASLLRPNIKFRVIARSSRSAELMRLFLNDLPRMDVDVVSFSVIPDLTNELVVLTIGERTAKFSKRNKKELLYEKNQLLVTDILPQIQSSTVIVVTNPSTAITKYLVEKGVQAYGVGVANDQLRFNNQAGVNLPNHYFVGAHNFHELILGSRHSTIRTQFLFSHNDYKDILSKQDKKILSAQNLPYSFLDFKWDDLEKTNAGFPPEYRWYARQRIHSKFHNTAISCSLAILNTICLLTKKPSLYNNFSLEMPLHLPDTDFDVVLGWPIDSVSMQPIELAFDNREVEKLTQIAIKYRIDKTSQQTPVYYLTSPFGDSISLVGNPEKIHEFFQTRLAHLFSLSLASKSHNKILATIFVENDRKTIDKAIAGYNKFLWKKIPQHRGKNPQEHSDIDILEASTLRVVRFPGKDSIGLFDDKQREAKIFFNNKDELFHELRRIIRDEIGIPCLVSRGARILHAGLISFKGITILIVGESGGGKTTSILSLLCSDKDSCYGSAERTLTWISNNKIIALGIPESVTIFLGTIKQIPEFEHLVNRTDEDRMWNPSEKIRLQMNDIIARTGSSPLQREVAVDLIIEVSYNALIEGAYSEKIIDNNLRKSLFMKNDLTENDPVRLPWLNWFTKSFSRKLYDFIEINNSIEMHSLKWSNMSALNTELINIIARKKLNDHSELQARVQV